MGNFLSYRQNQQKYVPDIRAFGILCELNYARLLKLLPDIEPAGKHYDYCVNDKTIYRLTIKECCKYTTIVTLVQLAPHVEDYLRPKLEVRLYHDADMAEVTASQNIHHIKGSYQYPNPQMMQKDEKYQLNQFLQAWLKMCHDYGQVAVDLSSY